MTIALIFYRFFCHACGTVRGGGGGVGLMGTYGQPGYVFRDFCLKQVIDFIIFCLKQHWSK